MPFYDYFCSPCKRRVSIFWPSMKAAREGTPRCPRCDGTELERRVSRFRVIKGRAGLPAGAGGEGADDLPFDEADLADLEREDPRAMARLFRRMSDETGETLEPEMEEVITRLEKGEDPEAIEASMGDGMGESGGGEESKEGSACSAGGDDDL